MKKFIFTRFGIGVFDPMWYEFRLSLFESITYPSINALKGEDIYWVIFIDEHISEIHKNKLEKITSKNSPNINIFIKKVKFVFQVPLSMKLFVESKTSETERFLLSRIDDDDALRHDTLSLIEEKCINNNRDHDLVFTFPVGYEFLVAERKILKCVRPFLTMNTFLSITREKLEDGLKIGHHRVKDWAAKKGMIIEEIVSDGPMYLYSRHKQSDSNFLGIRKTLLEDKNIKHTTQRVYSDFNMDLEKYQSFREKYNKFPTMGREKLWDRNNEHIQLAMEYYKKIDEIKEKMIENTKEVFK